VIGTYSGNKIDGHTLSSKTTTTTNTMDVVLAVGRQVVVDDQGDLLDIDATSQQVSGNKNTRRPRSELLHDQITLVLVHISMHGRHSEVTSSELLSEPINLSTGVAEDNSLRDGDSLVQVRQGIEFPFLFFDCNVKLLDTLQGQLSFLDKDADRVAHELGGDLQDVLGHRGRKQDNLSRLRKELENVVDLLRETTLGNPSIPEYPVLRVKATYRQHFVSLVKNEELDGIGLEGTALNHVVNTTRSTNNDMDTILENFHVVTNDSSSDTSMTLDVHEIADGNNDLLDLLGKLTGGSQDQGLALLDAEVDFLQDGDRESSGLSCAGLSLGDNIAIY
jgi:hypothetical protein